MNVHRVVDAHEHECKHKCLRMIIVHSPSLFSLFLKSFPPVSIGFLIHLIKWILDAKEGEDKGVIKADSAIVCNCILDVQLSSPLLIGEVINQILIEAQTN